MHQAGIARVALCFLAKFGLFYFFLTSVFAFASMYVLVVYFTNTVSDTAGSETSANKPVAPPETTHPRGLFDAKTSHLHIASNLKYLQRPAESPDPQPSRDLAAFVTQSHLVPSCGLENYFLTVLITSAPRNFRARSAIRDTWCSDNTTSVRLNTGHKSSNNVRCVFLLGKTLSKNIQRAVEKESQQHGDILQGTYLDTYRNLTVKVIGGLHWTSRHCPSDYVLKTDDDCFVNIPVLTKTLEDQPRQQNVYVGHVMLAEHGRQVIRDRRSKWEVSVEDFSEKYYPPYVSGSGYLISSDLVDVIVTLYSTKDLIPVEDAYVGILLATVGVTPTHSARFTVHNIKFQLCNFLYFIVIHRVDPTAQKGFMDQSYQSYSECKHHQAVFDWN